MPNKEISQFPINTSPSYENIFLMDASGSTMVLSLSALTSYLNTQISGGTGGSGSILTGATFSANTLSLKNLTGGTVNTTISAFTTNVIFNQSISGISAAFSSGVTASSFNILAPDVDFDTKAVRTGTTIELAPYYVNTFASPPAANCYGIGATNSAGTHVVIGSTGSLIRSTDSGATWSTYVKNESASLYAFIFYGNGLFVAGGNPVAGNVTLGPVLTYSTDGLNWNDAIISNSTQSTSIDGLAFGNGVFVMTIGLAATASNGYGLYRSTDGINWSEVPLAIPTTLLQSVKTPLQKVLFLGDRFVAYANQAGLIWYSFDGLTWTFSQLPIAQNINAIAYSNGRWHVFSAVANQSYYTNDFITWSTSNVTNTYYGSSGFANAMSSNGANTCIAISTTGARVLRSTDNGANWTDLNYDQIANPGVLTALNTGAAIAVTYYQSGVFYVVGSIGTFYSSDDGVTWGYTAHPIIATTNLVYRIDATKNLLFPTTLYSPIYVQTNPGSSVTYTQVSEGNSAAATNNNSSFPTTFLQTIFPFKFINNKWMVPAASFGFIIQSTDNNPENPFFSVAVPARGFSLGAARNIINVNYSSTANKYLMVGTLGTYSTSLDGITWTNAAPSGDTNVSYAGLDILGDIAVVGTSTGSVRSMSMSAATGFTTRATASGFTGSVSRIVNNGSRFIAVQNLASVKALASDDGTTWSGVTFFSASTLVNNALVLNNTFFIYHNNGFSYSNDGISWTSPIPTPASSGSTLIGITGVYDGATYINVMQNGSLVKSTDAINWTISTPATLMSQGTNQFFQSATNGSGTTVLVQLVYGQVAVTRDSGATWNMVAYGGFSENNSIRAVLNYANGYFVLMNEKIVWYSTDGFIWKTNEGQKNSSSSPAAGVLKKVNGRYFYIASISMSLTSTGAGFRTSTNIASGWTQCFTPLAYTASIIDVVFGAGCYIAAGAGGTILRSTDGINWADVSPISYQSKVGRFYFAGFGNGVFIVGGQWGDVYRSTDGINWTKIYLQSKDDLTAVSYGNGRWLIASNNNSIIWTSTNDGLNWSKEMVGTFIGAPAFMRFFNGFFYISYTITGTSIAGKGLFRSVDGVDWKLIKYSEAGGNVYGLTTDEFNNLYILDYYGVRTSKDGLNWKTANYSTYPVLGSSTVLPFNYYFIVENGRMYIPIPAGVSRFPNANNTQILTATVTNQ
jgi:hypothetical protein